MAVKHNEDWVKDRVKDILKARHAYYFMPSASQYGKSGIPDFIICLRGKFVAIETKALDDEGSPTQEEQMHKMRKAGGMTMVVNQYNLDKAAEWLDLL